MIPWGNFIFSLKTSCLSPSCPFRFGRSMFIINHHRCSMPQHKVTLVLESRFVCDTRLDQPLLFSAPSPMTSSVPLHSTISPLRLAKWNFRDMPLTGRLCGRFPPPFFLISTDVCDPSSGHTSRGHPFATVLPKEHLPLWITLHHDQTSQ